MKVKTHTFRLGSYEIEEADRLEGVCDTPFDPKDKLGMIVMSGNNFRALSSALHESMHADGIPDKYVHDKDGYSDTERIARFLWRLGYRRKK